MPVWVTTANIFSVSLLDFSKLGPETKNQPAQSLSKLKIFERF
jgi:hypothetical protein